MSSGPILPREANLPLDRIQVSRVASAEDTETTFTQGSNRASIKSLFEKCYAIKDVIGAFVALLVFTILYNLFIYYVLISGMVQFGGAFINASTANLLVSIFSQIYVVLADMVLHGLLETLRLALVVRGEPYLVTFMGIGSSTGWFSATKLLTFGWFPNLWRDMTYRLLGEGTLLVGKLALPFLGLGLGSVLKFQANFDYYFVPGPVEIDVFAGLIPLHNSILDIIPPATLCLYFSSWTSSMLENSKYATSFTMEGCQDGCRSVLLPGGVELARQVRPALNVSIYDGRLLNDTDTVRIENATGFALTFWTAENSRTFDLDQDCIYVGESINNTLQICTQQVDNMSISVGWAACPDNVWAANACNTNRSWVTSTMKWTTIMSAYRQTATTSYDQRNFSIVDFETTLDPEQVPILSDDYKTIFNKIFVPVSSNNAIDNSSIDSLIYTLTWLHRTYQGTFPDDQNSLLTNLHNLLTIPIQFTLTAVQYVNYTYPTLNYSVPESSQTIAKSGWSDSKLVIQSWTGYLFMTASSCILILAVVIMCWIVLLPEPVPRTSGIGDLDALRLAEKVDIITEQGDRQAMLNFYESEEASELSFGYKVSKKTTVLRVAGARNEEG